MSVAEVEKSGPFSNFEGMNRWFAVLSGSGVSLDMAGRIQHLTVNSAPFCFDGGEKINCHLLDGKTQDFNLMVRKSRANASMRRVNGLLQMTLKNPQIIAVYSINSETVLQVDEHSLCLPPSSLAWRHIHQPVKVSVSSTHALWMDIPE